MTTDTIGKFEMEVLLAVWSLRDAAYGVSIADRLEEKTGARPTVGKLYATLDRLTQKGFLEGRMSEPTHERGGRRKRYFWITAAGQEVAAAAYNRLHALANGLPLPARYGVAV